MKQSLIRPLVAALTLFGAVQTLALAAEKEAIEAEIKELTNKVLVNQGQGLVSAKQGLELRDGDTVVTLDKSETTIVFHDGCRLHLKANEMVTIDHSLHCKAAILASSGAPGAVGAAAGGLTLGQGILIGGAIVGGGILIGNSNNNNNNNGNNLPISPQ
jgi:hypothetical protein